MTKERKIYWSSRIPDELKELLAGTDTLITQQEAEESSCAFRMGGPNSNIFQKPVDWEKIKNTPVAYFNESLLEWDIPKLILKRFLAGEGGIGPEESYQGVLLKNNSIKILDSNSLGYFSDILTSTAVELKINPVNVRSFCVMLLSYLDYLKKSELVSFPLEVDYGLSQDSFFIQAHCENNGVFLENLMESAGENELDSPFVSILKEVSAKTDLLEVYTLRSTGKLVITACWVGNPHFIRKDYFSGLIVHQIDSFKTPSKAFGKIADAQTFHKESITNISKARVAEKLPQKYKKIEANTLKEIVNPVLVKRMVDFILEKNKGRDIDWNSYSVEQLREDSQDFPDKDALGRFNSKEENEVLKVLSEGVSTLTQEVEDVKKQINPDDYLTGLLNSLNNMTFEEAVVAGDFEDDSDEYPVSSGEDLGDDEIQKVSGIREDLAEEVQKVSGGQEDLTEEAQKISGTQEDLAEEVQKVKGLSQDTENDRKVVKGEKSSPQSNESFVVKGQKEHLKETSWQVKRLNVAKKVEEKVASLKEQNADHAKIDFEVKQIISAELNLDDEKSKSFVQALSDDVSDDFIHEGIDSVNENIKNRIRIEKMNSQLKIRDKQVEKMNSLITGLKKELSSAREELLNVRHPEVNNINSSEAELSPKDEVLELTESVPSLEVASGDPASIGISAETKVNLEKLRAKDEEITSLKQELAQLKDDDKETELKQEMQNLKSQNVEFEREREKLSNIVHKLERDNELLLKKFREGVEEVSEIRDSDEDAGALKEKNENLESQVESLKKKISFLYENSKPSKEIEVSANDVQKIIEDKDRYFGEKMKAKEEIDLLKSDLREKERLLKQKELEINQKSDLLKNKPVGEDEDIIKQKESEISRLKVEVKRQADELKATQLKTKSFEQKVKFLNAQLEKYQSAAGPNVSKGGAAIDAKVAAKLKQAEVLNARLKEAADKYKNELGEKKTELHKAKLEKRTVELKLKDMEKKLLQVVKKKAA